MKKKTTKRPDCYKCVHRMSIPGNAHSRCNNLDANVSGNPHGIGSGWFMWPLNFDPVWLEKCDGFSTKESDKKPLKKLDPLMELLSMLG